MSDNSGLLFIFEICTEFAFSSNSPKLQPSKIIDMKLKLYTIATLITVTGLAASAGSDNTDYIDKSIIPPGTDSAKALKAPANSTTQNNNTLPVNQSIIPGTSPVNITPQTLTQTATQIVTAPGMNPAHGQPGHRCDIAVGAALNSKPAPSKAEPVTVSTQQPQVTMKEVPNTQKTAPGMNPPHGEPNHRCDIAVGAALNSKPAPATPQTTTVSTQAPQVTTKEVPNTQKTAPGMNPPHGEPGHKCEIAVGSPLNSKPVANPVQTTKPPALLTPAKADSLKN